MTRPGVRSSALVALLSTAACMSASEGPLAPGDCRAPVVSRVAVTGDTANVLSVLVTAAVSHTHSVVVTFGVNGARDGETPTFTASGDSVVAMVLGLRPSTTYGATLLAFNRCGQATVGLPSFETGALPADLPSYTASGADTAPGYVVFAARNYGLVIDNSGRVVWYHRFPNGPGLNFQAQPDGRYAARPTAGAGEVSNWLEIAPDGTTTRTFGCARGLVPRMHDLIAQLDGSYWMLCDETRTMDLSAQGESRAARVLGTAVQHRSATGEVLFEWSPFDHLEVDLSILDRADRAAPVINWTHGNALDLDADGNLLVSFRNLSEVTKIDTQTGAVIWRMGGRMNAFTFEKAAAPAFARQHGVRVVAGGIVLLDNLGEPLGSRAERYDIDESRRLARLTDAYGASAGLVALTGGTTQPLPGGRTLVSFGSGSGVIEYDAAGKALWALEGDVGYIFRAQRIRSLYRPGVDDPR